MSMEKDLLPGKYQINVPPCRVNGTDYRAKEVTRMVQPDVTLPVVVHLDPVPLPPQPARVYIEPGYLNLDVGNDYELLAKVFDSNGQELPGTVVTWSATKLDVAVVDASGKVTAVGRGAGEIEAACGTATGSDHGQGQIIGSAQ